MIATLDPQTPDATDAVAVAALDLLADGVLVACDGVVVLANRALCRLTGLRADDLIGSPVPEWVPPAPAGGGEATAEAVLPVAGGRRRRVSVVVAARGLADQGPPVEVVTVRDRSAALARDAELRRRAERDGLTGLLNKRSFGARLAEEAERLGARGRPLALVIMDLDRFKTVNDEHGHPTGDRVLAEAAQRLTAEARAVDSVGRIGGEEFAWILPDASAAEALLAAERLRAAIAARPFANGLRVTASIGVCELGAADGDAETLVERADQALYWAKAHGRDAALLWTAATASAVAAAR